MNRPQYRQTPPGIMSVLQLFTKHHLSYLLFKCDHIFDGANKNLDILFETDEDYLQARGLLQQQGFVIRLSEKVEKYKTMYCGLIDGTLYSVHLHRHIAWHGMIALDKKEVFVRKKMITPLIIIPGLEDSILIHAAHIIFENFHLTQKELVYLNELNKLNDNHALDKNYLQQQVQSHHWQRGWRYVQQARQKGTTVLSTWEIVSAWMEKLMHEPKTAFYGAEKIGKKMARALYPKPSGAIISLIGVNGSGKSTLSRVLLEKYAPLTAHLGKKQQYYYFGWKPTFPLTKMISAILKRRQKGIFKEAALEENKKRQEEQHKIKFSLRQELMFLSIFAECYYRYLVHLRPLLRKNTLIVTDRYFYDFYGQYPYASQSVLMPLLLHLFPRPNATYVLDANEQTISQRQKTDKDTRQILAKERISLPLDYLHAQRNNYQKLAQQFSFPIISTDTDVYKCASIIIKKTWQKMLK